MSASEGDDQYGTQGSGIRPDPADLLLQISGLTEPLEAGKLRPNIAGISGMN